MLCSFQTTISISHFNAWGTSASPDLSNRRQEVVKICIPQEPMESWKNRCVPNNSPSEMGRTKYIWCRWINGIFLAPGSPWINCPSLQLDEVLEFSQMRSLSNCWLKPSLFRPKDFQKLSSPGGYGGIFCSKSAFIWRIWSFTHSLPRYCWWMKNGRSPAQWKWLVNLGVSTAKWLVQHVSAKSKWHVPI